MSEFVTLKPFRFWCQKVLPLVYDDSLSYYEVLCKVVDYINGLINDTNELSTEVNELREAVNNIETDIQTMVNNTIMQMAESGDLDSAFSVVYAALSESIVESNLSKTAKIGRIGRLLDDFRYGSNGTGGQSCTYDGSYYYTCGSFNSDEDQAISKFNSVGEIVGHQEYTELGHANDITYFNDKLYVANGNLAQIAIVDPSTLVIDDVMSFDGYDYIFAVTNDDDYLYCIAKRSAGNYVCRIDGEVIEELFRVTYFSTNIPQGMCFYHGNIFITSNMPNKFVEYTLNGEVKNIWYIPTDDGYFDVCELETAVVINGKLCAFSTVYLYGLLAPYRSKMTCHIMQLFATSIYNEDVAGFYQIEKPIDFAVTVNGSADFAFNPVTTFTTCEEACFVLNSMRHGTLYLSNKSAGFVFLKDGTFAMLGVTGTRTITDLVIWNAVVNWYQVGTTDSLTMTLARLNYTGASLPEAITLNRSEFKPINDTWSNVKTITYNRSEIAIEHMEGNLNALTTVTKQESTGGAIHYHGAYKKGLFKIFKSMTFGALMKIALPNVSQTPVLAYVKAGQLDTAFSINLTNGVYSKLEQSSTLDVTITTVGNNVYTLGTDLTFVEIDSTL